MIGVGGVSHKHYLETKGLKVCAGQVVKQGTIITRQGDKWKAGLNVSGKGSLQASLRRDGVFHPQARHLSD